MKVVLFCGGLGMRLREESENVPKPMVNIGSRPILWHLMKYYSYHGHNEFILCLGYKGDVIKDYFLKYKEAFTNDFILSEGDRRVELLGTDAQDWKITLVDTGVGTNIGQRLVAVEEHLQGDQVFLANYSDGLTDLPLNKLIAFAQRHDKIATFLSVKPAQTFHVVSMRRDGIVTQIHDVQSSSVWTNGGFFVFKREIFDWIQAGEDLVEEPFQRLIAHNEIIAHKHRGFWACMDTFKEKQRLEDLFSQGTAPWGVWERKQAEKAG